MNWNIQKVLLVIGLVLLLILPVSVSAKKDKPGVIKGWVNYCAQGGYVGMQVFIPGRQFMAILGEDGNFIFKGVPIISSWV